VTLLDRANEFVKTGRPRDQAQLLTECIRAHDLDGLAATQRLYEDMYGGVTFNFELKVSPQHDLSQHRSPPSKDDLSKNCSANFFGRIFSAMRIV
jgi:hypothetical protein